MINRLHLENFKCLRDVTVDFAPLTVLIGPNDSGKSSILEALLLLSNMQGRYLTLTKGETSSQFFAPDELNQLVWRRQGARDISWIVDGVAAAQDFHYEVRLPGIDIDSTTLPRVIERFSSGDLHRALPSAEERAVKPGLYLELMNCSTAESDFVEALRTTTRYKLEPDAIRKPIAPEPHPVLDATGANLATVLEALMTGPDRQALFGLEQTLYRTIPTLKGISVQTLSAAGSATRGKRDADKQNVLKALEFVLSGPERRPITIPAMHVSDGALLLTAYLALVYGDTPEILLIEEPENGLHPTRLKMIVDLLRQVTTGEVGNRRRQIIMTTHSPLLLNYCQPEEVRIVRRGEDGASKVTPLTDVPDLQRLLSEFAIGELWFLLTEDGLLRGERP